MASNEPGHDSEAVSERLLALGRAVAAYETDFGVITTEEIEEQRRADRRTARIVHGRGYEDAPIDP